MVKPIILIFAISLLMVKHASAQNKGRKLDSLEHAHKRSPIKIQYGIASFYANKFNGRRTSNGEIFAQEKMTAASNTLPLNTWVKVTNLRNKRTVIVRITDRMHWRNKRLIDLSRASAKLLGYTGHGLTRVKVEVLGKHYKPKESAPAPTPLRDSTSQSVLSLPKQL